MTRIFSLLRLQRRSILLHIVLVAVLAIAPVFIVMVETAIADRQDAVERYGHQALEIARIGAGRQRDMIAEIRAMLTSLARLPQIRSMSAGCHETVANAAVSRPYLQSLWAAGTDGVIACNSLDVTGAHSYIGDRRYFQRLMTPPYPGFLISEPILSRVLKQQAMVAAIALPASDNTGKGEPPRGILAATLDLQWFSDLGREIDEHGHVVAVFDGDTGEVIVREPQLPGRLPRLESRLLAVARNTRETGGAAEGIGPDGVERIYGFAALPDSGEHQLYLLIGTSKAEILAKADERQDFNIIIASLTSIMAVFVIVTMAHVTLSRPIMRLARLAGRLGRGDLAARDTRAEWNSREIAALGKAFNEMAGRVEQAQLQLKEANRQLEVLAITDGLTSLPNRRRLDEVLTTEIRRAARNRNPLGLVVIDIDMFKSYNDTHGHLAGDTCLRAVAEGVRRSLRRPADFVARYGGEEFIAVLPDTDEDAARRMAETMNRNVMALAIPHQASPYGVVTISAGVTSIIPDGDTTFDMMVQAADNALYLAKESGRNTVRRMRIEDLATEGRQEALRHRDDLAPDGLAPDGRRLETAEGSGGTEAGGDAASVN